MLGSNSKVFLGLCDRSFEYLWGFRGYAQWKLALHGSEMMCTNLQPWAKSELICQMWQYSNLSWDTNLSDFEVPWSWWLHCQSTCFSAPVLFAQLCCVDGSTKATMLLPQVQRRANEPQGHHTTSDCHEKNWNSDVWWMDGHEGKVGWGGDYGGSEPEGKEEDMPEEEELLTPRKCHRLDVPHPVCVASLLPSCFRYKLFSNIQLTL